jgi:hypothetical protein
LFAGLAVFVEFVVVVVEVVFETCEPLVFEFIVDEFEFIEFDGAVVVVEDELVTVVEVAFEFDAMFVFE